MSATTVQDRLSSPRVDTKSWLVAAFAVISALGGAWVFYATTLRPAMDLTTDSGVYLNAARHLMRGDGYLHVDGSHIVTFPPGYSVVIAAVGSVSGLDLEQAARLIGIVGLAVTVFCTGLICLRVLPASRRWLSLVAATVVAVSPIAVFLGVTVWSELLFIALVSAAATVLTYQVPPSIQSALIVGLLLDAAFMTRTAGAFAVIAALAVYALRRQWRDGIVMGVVAAAGPAGWSLYNRMIAGAANKDRGTPSEGPLEIVEKAGRTVLSWGASTPTPSALEFVIIGAGVAALAALAVVVRRDLVVDPARVPLVFAASFVVCTIVVRIFVHMDPLGTRLMAPAFPFLVITMIMIIAATPWTAVRVAATVGVAGVVALGLVQGVAWARSPLVFSKNDAATTTAACELPDDGVIVSNSPYLLTWTCDRPSSLSPSADVYELSTPGWLTHLAAEHGCVRVVWFDSVNRGYLSTLSDLERVDGIHLDEQFKRGSIHSLGCPA